MKASEIYRQAAKRIEDGKQSHCCTAIMWIEKNNHNVPLQKDMKDLFAPDSQKYCWMEESGEGISEETTDRRILALCFMAAIAESEGN